jgi:hypothetical protein
MNKTIRWLKTSENLDSKRFLFRFSRKMTPKQRQAAFDRYFTEHARKCSQRLGLGYLGTIRKLPPPPLPGEAAGATHLNAVAKDGSRSGLVELGGTADAALRRAEKWVSTGEGLAPALSPAKAARRPR